MILSDILIFFLKQEIIRNTDKLDFFFLSFMMWLLLDRSSETGRAEMTRLSRCGLDLVLSHLLVFTAAEATVCSALQNLSLVDVLDQAYLRKC